MSYMYHITNNQSGVNMEKPVFNTTQLQSKIGTVLSSVQTHGEVEITNRSRPSMTLMLTSERDALHSKINQLADLIKSQK